MEPKVVGPLTFKQFIIISIGTTLSFAVYFLLGPVNIKASLALILVIYGLVLFSAFGKRAAK